MSRSESMTTRLQRRCLGSRLRFRSRRDVYINTGVLLGYVLVIWLLLGHEELPSLDWRGWLMLPVVVLAVVVHIRILHALGR